MKEIKLTTEILVNEIQKRENILENMEIDSSGFGYYVPYSEEQQQRDNLFNELDELYEELKTRHDAPEEFKEMF